MTRLQVPRTSWTPNAPSARAAFALLAPALLALAPLAGAAAEQGTVVARGAFVAHESHEIVGTVELVALPGGELQVRFLPDFRFVFLVPPPLAPLGEPPVTLDVRILSAAEPTNLDAALAETPVPGALGMPDAVLGPLQARQGAQAYGVPPGTEAAKVGSVVLHCRDFQSIMGHATMVAV